MPSRSYNNFLLLLTDVDRLVETHYLISNGTVGKKKLGHLTRSAVVMLCAAWERYNENLLLELIDLILTTNLKAEELPTSVKQFISTKVKENKNEIYPIELADNGWKNLWKGYATNEIDSLHTPNSNNLNKLFKRHLGIPRYTDFWKASSIDRIDSFIKKRGGIAHKGSEAKYVRIDSLKSDIDLSIDNAIQIDSCVSDYLFSHYSIEKWNNDYRRSRG